MYDLTFVTRTHGQQRMMVILEQMAKAVVDGDTEACKILAQKAHEEGIDAVKAVQEGFSAGMKTIGKSFEKGDIFLPEMMQAAEAMNARVDILKPHIVSGQQKDLMNVGKVLLATIQGDMHDIGKNIVKILMSTSGFDVVDLGKDVKVADIVEQADDRKVDTIGVSALMTTTM